MFIIDFLYKFSFSPIKTWKNRLLRVTDLSENYEVRGFLYASCKNSHMNVQSPLGFSEEEFRL